MFLQYPDMMVIETFSCNACKKYREEINAIAMLAHLFQERCDYYFCEADSAAAVRVLWVLSQYYFYCCQIIWLLLLIRSTRTYYDL